MAMPQIKCLYPNSYIASIRAASSSFSSAQRGSLSREPHGSFAGRCPVKQQVFTLSYTLRALPSKNFHGMIVRHISPLRKKIIKKLLQS